MLSQEWWTVYSSVLGAIASRKFQGAYTEKVLGGAYLDNPDELELTDFDFGMAANMADRATQFALARKKSEGSK